MILIYGDHSEREAMASLSAITNVTDARSVVAVFSDHLRAKRAVDELSKHGLDTNVTLISGDASLSCLDGAAFFLIPQFGPLTVVGPIVTWIVDAVQTPVIVEGVSAFGAGLVSLGVPVDQARRYESSVTAGRCLLITVASQCDIFRIFNILRAINAISIDARFVPPEPTTPPA